MLLLTCSSLYKSFGSKVLFKNISFSVFEKNRIGLIGPNGAGKSTLLKILEGTEAADSGEVICKKGLKIGYVPQITEFPDLSPREILNQKGHPEHIVSKWLSKTGFRGDELSAKHLSGGWKKRLSLACALIDSPDLLLLDEPTNHLDLEAVLWLEKFLEREVASFILVSHDRAFLTKSVNRIIDLDPTYPEGLFSIDGNYEFFLIKKREFLTGQIAEEHSLASKVRHQKNWLQSSPKARTTKARARVDEANEIIDEHKDLKKRNQKREAGIGFISSERETQKLIVCKNVSKSLGEKLLFKHLDLTLSPKTRLGLIGSNGSGKTTLLRLLVDEIKPDMGTIKRADDLKIVYFDQHRMKLDENLTLKEALSPGGDFVNFRGQSIHVNGWCKRFLFTEDCLAMPIKKLSGGERARISIAHLMLEPADVLLLDEPTNDLDISTLEILEESLIDFPGAIVLITHDRFMMEKVCNQFLTLGEEKKKIQEKKPEKIEEKKKKSALTYFERKEFESIEEKIKALEEKMGAFQRDLEIETSSDKLVEICKNIDKIEKEINHLYSRFEELESKL